MLSLAVSTVYLFTVVGNPSGGGWQAVWSVVATLLGMGGRPCGRSWQPFRGWVAGFAAAADAAFFGRLREQCGSILLTSTMLLSSLPSGQGLARVVAPSHVATGAAARSTPWLQ